MAEQALDVQYTAAPSGQLEERTDHSRALINLCFAKALERFGYYGSRAILVLFMVEGAVALSHEEALDLYTTFMTWMSLPAVLGGLLGDIIGRRKLLSSVGLAIQGVACLFFMIESRDTLIVGIVLMVVGSVLHMPNLMSFMGDVYHHRKARIGSAVLIIYMAINIGAFGGPLFIGQLYDIQGYSIGFLLAAMVTIIASIVMFMSPSGTAYTGWIRQRGKVYQGLPPTKALYIVLVLIGVPVFWMFYDIHGGVMFDLFDEIEESGLSSTSFNLIFQSTNIVVILLVGIILAVVTSFRHIPHMLMIGIGFCLMALSWVYFDHLQASSMSITLFTVTLVLVIQSLAEISISPMALAVIARHCPQHIQGTIFGLYFGLARVAILSVGYFSLRVWGTQFTYTAMILGAIGAIALILHFTTKLQKL